MKITFRSIKEQAASALNEISNHHTRGLLEDEEMLIRTALRGALANLDLTVSDECAEYWSKPVSAARGRLSFETGKLPLRKNITDKIHTILGTLKSVSLNESQKETLVNSISGEIKKCITELMNSRRKRQEERKKAKAVTQSSMDIPSFDEEKMVREPDDSRKIMGNPKPQFKRVSASGRFGRR